MRYEIQPLGTWLDPITKSRRSSGTFGTATWNDTLRLLGFEVDKLGTDLVVIQVNADADDIRRDGMLRAHARVKFPGVRISFTSRFGPLTYSTDVFDRPANGALRTPLPGWQANIRAIALALEALRKVDRYGVSRRGEQYRGWTQITATPAEMTPQQAAEFIAHWAADDRFTAARVLTDSELRSRALKVAAAKTHPDRTGDPDTFARLTAARNLLEKGAA